MAFDVTKQDGGWFVCDGPIRFGPYGSCEKAEDSAAALNRQTQNGGRSPLADGVGLGITLGRNLAEPVPGRADELLRRGRSDEEVERLTGASLEEILSLRAGSAAGSHPALKRGASAGRRGRA